MDKLNRIKELTEKLHKASIAYYQYDNPIYTDKHYDDMYDELEKLEQEMGIVLAGSPTQKVQGYLLKGLEKQKHSKPMLSAAKTKDTKEIESFVNGKDFYCSYKLDGLTLVVIFEDGELKTALTRGSGEEGEIVTEAAKMISNLPKKINYKDRLELRGECIVSWSSFNYINERLKEPFSHPRNMAAGSIRNLDTNVARDRMLEFVVFECVTDIGIDSKLEVLNKLDELGFTTVPRCINTVEESVEIMQPEFIDYPCDGLIFEINSRKLSESLGVTSHHENVRIALKWEDETYETVFREIEWNTTRSGLVNPTAIFDTVNIQGSDVSRATLHNLSYIEELELGEGDTIEVYKANMIIPKIHNNLTRSNTWTYPEYCPCCDYPTEIHNENGSKTLHCINPDCSAKFISKLTNFVNKNGMNIVGLSESTLETLVEKKYVTSFIDLYHLDRYKGELSSLSGFGARSVAKLLESIENSRNTTLDKFLTALSIPGIGKSSAKIMMKKFGSMELFKKYVYYFTDDADNNMDEHKMASYEYLIDWTTVDGFEQKTHRAIVGYFNENADMVLELLKELSVEFPEEKKESNTNNSLEGMTFVVTGSVNHFKNRSELQERIEQLGGKVAGSVSAKTSVLINNDSESNSSKNVKAKSLQIPIWTEEDFLKYIGG